MTVKKFKSKMVHGRKMRYPRNCLADFDEILHDTFGIWTLMVIQKIHFTVKYKSDNIIAL